MKNKIIFISLAVCLLVLFFGIGVKVYKSQRDQEISEITKKDIKKLVPDYAPRLGHPNPKIYLVEFLDPECESCREMYPFVKMILKDYENKIQLVVRYATFHTNSKMAVKILEAARKQGKYWETMDVLMNYQPQWASHQEPRPDLIWKFLPEAGVDIEKIKKDMNDPAIEELIVKEEKDVFDLGIRQTPTFFINGTQVHLFGYEPLNQLIQSELKEIEK